MGYKETAICPNLIGIGGQKCATTWLSECLRQHPEVFMSSPKELRYFTDNKDRGFEWYSVFFQKSGSYKFRAEFSTNYLYHPGCARDIKAHFGEIKILAVVRDPVERSLSHIKHLIRDSILPNKSGLISDGEIREIFASHPEVILNSLYFDSLCEYVDHFGRDSVLIISHEDINSRPDLVLKALWSFLGVNYPGVLRSESSIVGAGVVPKLQWLERARVATYKFLKFRFPTALNLSKELGISTLYRKLNDGGQLTLSEDARMFILRRCEDDWNRTRALCVAL